MASAGALLTVPVTAPADALRAVFATALDRGLPQQVAVAAGTARPELHAIIKQQHQTRMEGRWATLSTQRGFLLLAHEYPAVFRRPDALPQPATPDHGLAGDHDDTAHLPRESAAAFGTTVWTLPAVQPETTLPEVARQVLGQRGAAAEVLFLRTPQLLTRAGANTTDMLSRRLDQVTPRVAPGGVLAVEIRDVRIDGGLQPLGLEVYRALRRRRGMHLKEDHRGRSC